MKYPPELVSRAKGLMLAGIGPRLLSRISDIPYHTLREWEQELNRANIPADPTSREMLRGYIFSTRTP